MRPENIIRIKHNMAVRVHTIVSENSLKYFEYMEHNFRALASGDLRLSFVAHCLDKESASYLIHKKNGPKVVKVYRETKHFVVQSLRDQARVLTAKIGLPLRMAGSNGHSAGLSSALSMTGGGIDIVADTDTVMLQRGWDLVISALLENNGIVGTCYEDIGGFSSGNGKIQTYKRKPSLTWFALSPKFNWRRFDPRPAKYKNLLIKDDELSSLYNLPIGYELVRDVGWQVPNYMKANNIPFLVFDQIKPTSPQAMALRTEIDYHEEYHLDAKPFVAHQRGSHQHPFRGNDISRSFYDACDLYMQCLDKSAGT